MEWNSIGPQGEPGPPGLGVQAWYIAQSDLQMVNPGSKSFPAIVLCEVGDYVTGGGYNIQANNPGCVAVVRSMADGQDEWSVQVVNECDTQIRLLSQEVCIGGHTTEGRKVLLTLPPCCSIAVHG